MVTLQSQSVRKLSQNLISQ